MMRKSFVWNYFQREVAESTEDEECARDMVQCSVCGTKLMYINKSTSSMRRHLQMKHNVQEHGDTDDIDIPSQSFIDLKESVVEGGVETEPIDGTGEIENSPDQEIAEDGEKITASLKQQRPGLKRSWVWQYFEFVIVKGRKLVKCKKCSCMFSYASSTSQMIRHLRNRHGTNDGCEKFDGLRRIKVKSEPVGSEDDDNYGQTMSTNADSDESVNGDECDMGYENLKINILAPHVYNVQFNRTEQSNSFTRQMLTEIHNCFEELSDLPECRVIIISGNGRQFSTGMTLDEVLPNQTSESQELSQHYRTILKTINEFQESISAIEKCSKPVIAAVHKGCAGHALDLLTATDIRFCSKDAYFQVKEVDYGVAPDTGTLQRLPKIIGSQSLVSELCFSGRKMTVDEAFDCGLVSRVFDDRKRMMIGAVELAVKIAEKNPAAVQGIKKGLLFARDHSVADGLDQIASWNAIHQQSRNFAKASVSLSARSGANVQFNNL